MWWRANGSTPHRHVTDATVSGVRIANSDFRQKRWLEQIWRRLVNFTKETPVRPVATQHPLRNCVDHLAALSHICAPPRVQTGQQQS